MKKVCVVAAALAIVLSLCPAASEAGTFLVGAKYWYTNWDSGVLDWFQKDISAGFKAVGVNLQSDVDRGKGWLAGPVLGYQTDDGSWNFSMAIMAFSDFTQDWTGSAGTMNLATNIDTTRRDYDFAVAYSLARHKNVFAPFEYFRVFVGYKYQTVDYDLVLTYNTTMGVRTYRYNLDAKVHMPTVGIGFTYPIFEKLVFGAQAGAGIALIDLTMTDPDGKEFDIDPKYSFAFNTEANLTFTPYRNFIMQLGFRYQEWYLEARSPERWDTTTSRDTTFGPTATIVYTF